MDKTDSKLVLPCPSALSPSQVSVVFDPSYDRIPYPDTELENSVFEYGGYTLSNRAGSEQDLHACLHLGLTDYRIFMGTNLNPLWDKFLLPSEDDPKQCQHTSSPLGNSAIVETSDQKIEVLQRSYNVVEFPRHFVFPGGHPELKQRRSSNFESVYVWTNQQLSKRSTEIVQIAEAGSSITDVLGR
ncbi:hypothetical protein H0E87_001759 [Populus deltoides]|uniref:Uncharacterized protein n=1 Tax=Populus deltoides TaxID=3696 RepID=A0A8T2ZT00_POPDE|nr:hypothetical protein H0E87_001759 [Populus deltoides]